MKSTLVLALSALSFGVLLPMGANADTIQTNGNVTNQISTQKIFQPVTQSATAGVKQSAAAKALAGDGGDGLGLGYGSGKGLGKKGGKGLGLGLGIGVGGDGGDAKAKAANLGVAAAANVAVPISVQLNPQVNLTKQNNVSFELKSDDINNYNNNYKY